MSRSINEHNEREAGRGGKRTASGLSPWDEKMRVMSGLTVEAWKARHAASTKWHAEFQSRVAASLAARKEA